jgi:hypothetical protein
VKWRENREVAFIILRLQVRKDVTVRTIEEAARFLFLKPGSIIEAFN